MTPERFAHIRKLDADNYWGPDSYVRELLAHIDAISPAPVAMTGERPVETRIRHDIAILKSAADGLRAPGSRIWIDDVVETIEGLSAALDAKDQEIAREHAFRLSALEEGQDTYDKLVTAEEEIARLLRTEPGNYPGFPDSSKGAEGMTAWQIICAN